MQFSGQSGKRARVGRFFCCLKNSLKIFVKKLAQYCVTLYLCPNIHANK